MRSHSAFDDKYMGKYRIHSARHPTWDYSSNGRYFITICTHKRYPYFGKIINQKMHLSEIGKWADACWREIPSHFPFTILHNHIIMPDHMHGIIEIAKPKSVQTQDIAFPNTPDEDLDFDQTQDIASPLRPDQNLNLDQTQDIASPSAPGLNPGCGQTQDIASPSAPGLNPGCGQTQDIASLPAATDPPAPLCTYPSIFSKNKFGPQSKNLASIIRGYKIGVTKNVRKINPAFKWHPRFYDIIIRDERAFHTI